MSSSKEADLSGSGAPGTDGKSDPIDLRSYVPFFLGAIAYKWTAVSSRAYRDAHDIGIGDWRVLASLAVYESATSLTVSKLVKMDGGAVSRSIRFLEERSLVSPVEGRFVGRSRPYRMTAQGAAVYESVKASAFQREEALLAPLNSDERQQLLTLLGKLYDNLDEIDR